MNQGWWSLESQGSQRNKVRNQVSSWTDVGYHLQWSAHIDVGSFQEWFLVARNEQTACATKQLLDWYQILCIVFATHLSCYYGNHLTPLFCPHGACLWCSQQTLPRFASGMLLIMLMCGVIKLLGKIVSNNSNSECMLAICKPTGMYDNGIYVL